jgi:hypothetical protein
MKSLLSEKQQKEASATLLKEMESISLNMRELIVGMPPDELIGYIYSQRLLKANVGQEHAMIEGDELPLDDTINETQFLLEYVHAVLASDIAPLEMKFEEAKYTQLLALSSELMQKSMFFAIATSAPSKEGIFGPNTGDIEFRAKSNWVILRGHRHQVLEGEFYSYVLAPHDNVLNEVYGIGAAEIAAGFQDMTNATRSGHVVAFKEMAKQFAAANAFATEQGKPLEEVMETWKAENVKQIKAASQASDDMFRGGIANVSRHTNLPEALLADLAYERGEENDFFAGGDHLGTPYRTLPARKKPLIKLGEDYYAIDPCFARDAGYRALLFNLLERKPEYKETFKERQKIMSEEAFSDILANQLPDATIYNEVYYKDPKTKQWCENDTLILIDDVLYLVEAKAGAAATIASPALDFQRHAQSIKDLVLKAYKQCERFFNYLNSADEVLIYRLQEGKYIECGRLCHDDYRVMVPIGLTVESFSPFSAYCKELPEVKPLLGKHAFVSMSIDDLFVLKRLLPTAGAFAHYMEVRQAVAGIRQAHLYDEFDHLGAYISQNRFDLTIVEQLKDGEATLTIWDGMSAIVDRSFEQEGWEKKPLPVQEFPIGVLELLASLDSTRASGWLKVDSYIRDFDVQARNNLAKILNDLGKTLVQHPARYFTFLGDGESIFVWIEREKHETDWQKIHDKASAASLNAQSDEMCGLLVKVSIAGKYVQAQYFKVHIPIKQTLENMHIYDDAKKMSQPRRTMSLDPTTAPQRDKQFEKVGRNKQCPCGSGVKYKKCHGR